MSLDVDAAIKKYVELRDDIERIGKETKDRIAPLAAAMEKLAGVLMHVMNESGGLTQLKSTSGTAFITNQTRCSIGNKTEFAAYIRREEAEGRDGFALLTLSANKTAVQTHINTHETPPPGVSWSVVREVQVRRPS